MANKKEEESLEGLTPLGKRKELIKEGATEAEAKAESTQKPKSDDAKKEEAAE